jgi:hypothetical protein
MDDARKKRSAARLNPHPTFMHRLLDENTSPSCSHDKWLSDGGKEIRVVIHKAMVRGRYKQKSLRLRAHLAQTDQRRSSVLVLGYKRHAFYSMQFEQGTH